MEAYVRQKRAAPGMVQASDMRPMSAATGRSASQHLLQQHSPQSPHAYDGPMQFMMSPHNPDQNLSMSPNNEGEIIAFSVSAPFSLPHSILFRCHRNDIIEPTFPALRPTTPAIPSAPSAFNRLGQEPLPRHILWRWRRRRGELTDWRVPRNNNNTHHYQCRHRTSSSHGLCCGRRYFSI